VVGGLQRESDFTREFNVARVCAQIVEERVYYCHISQLASSVATKLRLLNALFISPSTV
jgi:hypothetical protein